VQVSAISSRDALLKQTCVDKIRECCVAAHPQRYCPFQRIFHTAVSMDRDSGCHMHTLAFSVWTDSSA
jgi:hypothetical protein